jgi:hypothetical protein
MNCGPAVDLSGLDRFLLAEERDLLMTKVNKMSARQFNEPEGMKINARIDEIDRAMGSPL